MNALSRYSRTQNETASKERLMMLLFEKALRDLRAGAELLEAGEGGSAVYPLTSASDIVSAMGATLDERAAPQLAGNLKALYGFCAARLTRAAISKNAKLAREAERALAPIVEAFAKAVAQAGSDGR